MGDTLSMPTTYVVFDVSFITKVAMTELDNAKGVFLLKFFFISCLAVSTQNVKPHTDIIISSFALALIMYRNKRTKI